MNKNVMWIALLLACSSSVAMADITLNFTNANQGRDLSTSGDSITFDFAVDAAGAVVLDATAVGGTDPEYLTAVDSWDGAVGTVADTGLWNTDFQITAFVTLRQRVDPFGEGTERISVDGRYGDGIMGAGGGNGSRVDWTSGDQEFLHFQQTGGTAQIQLLNFGWHAASTATALWDTDLRKGNGPNPSEGDLLVNFTNLPGFSGVADVSTNGVFIGSGINELTFSQPLDGSHGIGLDFLTLQASVVPEPGTFGLLAAFGTALMVRRRRS